jgi:hypothetical protein
MNEKQFPLFEGAPKAESVLRVGSGQRRQLTAAQRTFNKLVARVENLRTRLSRETDKLNAALSYYGQHLEPKLRRMNALRKDIVRALAPYLSSGKLKSKTDRKTLRTIMAEQLQEVASFEGFLQDDDLRALFQTVSGVDFETAQQEEMEDTRNKIESVFEELGFAVDLSDFDRDMTESDFNVRMAEIAEDLGRQAGAQRPKRKKTRKQIEREEQERRVEEVRKKSIARIYKQLARVLHPDLEADPPLKRKKETVMQELTVAYHANDLHTLLRLELEWIHREQSDLDRLTEEKLLIYCQALREQILELEADLEALPYHPRYEVLSTFEEPFGPRVRTDGAVQKRELDHLIASMESSLEGFRSEHGIEVVRTLIRETRQFRKFAY